MGLCADTVDELAVRVGAADEGNHTLDLGVVGVEVVIVDVEFGGWVSSAGGLECDGDERLSSNVSSSESSGEIYKLLRYLPLQEH
jgi:hypothetical protein